MDISALTLRSTRFLRMVIADIWAPPPNMVEDITAWLTSVYATNVMHTTKYHLTLEIDAIREAESIAENISLFLTSLEANLNSLGIGENHLLNLNFTYHDKYSWPNSTQVIINKLGNTKYNLIINIDGKEVQNYPVDSVLSLNIALHDFFTDPLGKIHYKIEHSELINYKTLLTLANKVSKGVSGTDTIANFPIDLEYWPYVQKVLEDNKKWLKSYYDHNVDELARMRQADSELVDLGDYAGPFRLFDTRGIAFEIDAMKGVKGIDVQFSVNNKVVEKKTFVNLNFLASAYQYVAVTKFDKYLSSAQNHEYLQEYLLKEFPKYSSIRVVYDAREDPDADLGLWNPITFELTVRPIYPDPIVSAQFNGQHAINLFDFTIKDLADTVRHEMQHCAQTIASLLTSGQKNTQYGLPAASTSPFKNKEYDVSGRSADKSELRPLREFETKQDATYRKEPDVKEEIVLKHPLRDIEYHTRLADEVALFEAKRRFLPKALVPRAIKIWVGELNEPLIPFHNRTTWVNYNKQHYLPDTFILDFIKEYKLPVPNLEKDVKNKLTLGPQQPIDRSALYKELMLLGQTSEMITRSEFFQSLKDFAKDKSNISGSRWADAVSKFVKEVL